MTGMLPLQKRLALAARRLALRAVPDLSLDSMVRLAHGAMLLRGAESWTGALALYAAHQRPDLCAAVAGLNPAGAELSDEAIDAFPSAFTDVHDGAAHMAGLLFARTPWPFWLVARDFARLWGSPLVQRILDDARAGSDRSLGLPVLTDIRVPALIVWGEQDRLLPLS